MVDFDKSMSVRTGDMSILRKNESIYCQINIKSKYCVQKLMSQKVFIWGLQIKWINQYILCIKFYGSRSSSLRRMPF